MVKFCVKSLIKMYEDEKILFWYHISKQVIQHFIHTTPHLLCSSLLKLEAIAHVCSDTCFFSIFFLTAYTRIYASVKIYISSDYVCKCEVDVWGRVSPIGLSNVAPSAHYCSPVINVFSVFVRSYYHGGPVWKPPDTDINFEINHCFSHVQINSLDGIWKVTEKLPHTHTTGRTHFSYLFTCNGFIVENSSRRKKRGRYSHRYFFLLPSVRN